MLAVGGRGLVALYRPESEDSNGENDIAAPAMTLPPSDDVVVDSAGAAATTADDVSADDVTTTDATVQSPPTTSTQVNISRIF